MMKHYGQRPRAGFTISELLISMTLALAVLTAVLSSYIFLGRSLTRLANQQTLEAESRRALAFFARDVRSASAASGTPSASSLTLIAPNGTVAYDYNSAAGTLTRTPATGSALVLASNIVSGTFAFRYYDESGIAYDNGSPPYTPAPNFLSGIKQVTLTFTTRRGLNSNGTQTPPHQVSSPRLILRNRSLLP